MYKSNNASETVSETGVEKHGKTVYRFAGYLTVARST